MAELLRIAVTARRSAAGMSSHQAGLGMNPPPFGRKLEQMFEFQTEIYGIFTWLRGIGGPREPAPLRGAPYPALAPPSPENWGRGPAILRERGARGPAPQPGRLVRVPEAGRALKQGPTLPLGGRSRARQQVRGNHRARRAPGPHAPVRAGPDGPALHQHLFPAQGPGGLQLCPLTGPVWVRGLSMQGGPSPHRWPPQQALPGTVATPGLYAALLISGPDRQRGGQRGIKNPAQVMQHRAGNRA